MNRVLRPGGRLLLLDHVAAASRLGVLQWLLGRITVPLAGEQVRRPPLVHVQAEGFQVQRRERSKLGIVERLAARKPAGHHG
jgi:ubiquinone/menaquinone biosynthesis C-methylase UbiE